MTSNQTSEQQAPSPVEKWLSKEVLLERAKQFMVTECGKPRDLSPEHRQHWHENMGLLMLCLDYIWEQQ